MTNNIKKLILDAYKTVPLYVRLAENKNVNIEDILDRNAWNELPVISKDHMIDQESGSLTPEAAVKYYKNELLHGRTSGSTGKYLEICWDKNDYTKSMLPLWVLRKQYYGITTSDKMCYFFTFRASDGEEKIFEYQKNQMGVSKCNLSTERLLMIYDEMLKFSPVWMTLQPSIVTMLCDCVEKHNKKPFPELKYIEMTGEILSESVRARVKKVFGCNVANQYGANEFNSIAYECPCGNMHVLGSNVIVEILDNKYEESGGEENEGSICITSLQNRSMPFIRYEIGDNGVMDYETHCSCGNANPILKLMTGRSNDRIVFRNGETASAYVFVRVIDCINAYTDGAVKQFQVIQEDYDNFLVKLVIDDESYTQDEVKELFFDNLQENNLKKYQIKICICSKLVEVKKKWNYFVSIGG